MEFRRSINRMLNAETPSGTADAVVATAQENMTRQERLSQWKEERNRNALKQRNDQNIPPASQNAAKPTQPAKKVLVINRKSRATMGPASFSTKKAVRRATTLRRSSEFVGAERVLQKRHETPAAQQQENRTPMATRNPMPPSAFTPSRFVPSAEDALLIARTPSSPDEYAVDIVHKLRSQVARKDAVIAHLESELNSKASAASDQNMVSALQQELNRLHEANQQQTKEHQARMEQMEASLREEYRVKLSSMEQELQLAHKEIEELRLQRQQAWPVPEAPATPTKPYLKRSSGMVEMVPRAELTEAVYARELAEAKQRDIEAEAQEMQECMTECAAMIEELSGQQQALEAAIEEKAGQIDALMNRCMVAEFRVNEVDELVSERAHLAEQLAMAQRELQRYRDGGANEDGDHVQDMSITMVEKDAHTYQQAVTTLTKQREASEKEWKAIMENTVAMRQETMNCLAEKVKRCQELSKQLKEANETIETLKQPPSADGSRRHRLLLPSNHPDTDIVKDAYMVELSLEPDTDAVAPQQERFRRELRRRNIAFDERFSFSITINALSLALDSTNIDLVANMTDGARPARAGGELGRG
ncbi:hypothetical protein SYNPS1DRAFT_22674 [Syncephalis pseudoplumigaleata]|uniref:Uncharacterized protein n=1 Tax=Syncephalis pseudoplumigaleata TaxID=1712513 RepID=A0A4P9YYZ8_9FUNG|nr:hypothetical protein SYNPS1DRAFT_22674 [Syncephalis pseudoplumigaleata]|eukprot:RKP25347.1 hypothetical protein SYNPS1DRAFT_22674 [Syncephalis pseudoplumigaleata]